MNKPSKNLQYGIYAKIFSARTNSAILLVSTKYQTAIDEWQQLEGVRAIITEAARPRLAQLIRENTNQEAGRILGVSEHYVVRLKRSLGLELKSRKGTSRTTVWRKKKKGQKY